MILKVFISKYYLLSSEQESVTGSFEGENEHTDFTLCKKYLISAVTPSLSRGSYFF